MFKLWCSKCYTFTHGGPVWIFSLCDSLICDSDPVWKLLVLQSFSFVLKWKRAPSRSTMEPVSFCFQFACRYTWENKRKKIQADCFTVCGTLHWIIKAVSRVELSVLSGFSADCLAPASLLSSSSSDRRLLSLSSRDSLSSVESSAVLSLRSSASVGPSLVSANGERTLAVASRASPRSRVMFPSSRRRWTMLWGC